MIRNRWRIYLRRRDQGDVLCRLLAGPLDCGDLYFHGEDWEEFSAALARSLVIEIIEEDRP